MDFPLLDDEADVLDLSADHLFADGVSGAGAAPRLRFAGCLFHIELDAPGAARLKAYGFTDPSGCDRGAEHEQPVLVLRPVDLLQHQFDETLVPRLGDSA